MLMRRVFIDCAECIPCNPCEHACPAGAIYIGANITNRPQISPENCTGCGRCVAACPGQACFLVDPDCSGEATLDFPYEYLPLPVPGMEVTACNNDGEILCTGRILKVNTASANLRTNIVRMAVPQSFAYQVRGIRPLQFDGR